jgi:hypothetical protein
MHVPLSYSLNCNLLINWCGDGLNIHIDTDDNWEHKVQKHSVYMGSHLGL